MEMTLNMTAFEPMAFDEMLCVDGGRNWLATISGSIAGVACIVGGIAGLCLPEPTTASKVIGWAAIVCGCSTIVWAWS